MILKPFMLRRIKKDVENELSDKVGERGPMPPLCVVRSDNGILGFAFDLGCQIQL